MKIKLTIFLISIIHCFCNQSLAQVEINGKVEFTNSFDSLRNIYSLSAPDSLDEAVRLYDFNYQKFFDDSLTITDSILNLNTSFEYPAYTTGMNLILQLPVFTDTINTPIYLKINQQSAVKIVTADGLKITNTVMKSNAVILLIFDGLKFVLINVKTNKCPNGFKKINDKYCIQKNRNGQATFWNAHKFCNDRGYHMCTLQEWYYACLNNTNLVNMPLNYEWVHSSSNHNIHALIIGNSSNCTNAYSETTATTGLPHYYRCCYHIK
jgi:hypothetical protein